MIMRLLLWLLIPFCLLGCDGSIFDDDDVRPTITEPSEEYRVPTITIKKLESEKIEEHPTVRGEKITWRLDADLAPITDVVIQISIPSADNQSINVWVLIPKFKPTSEVFTNTIYGGAIEVVALPMLSIVGKGLVVNVEKLREGLPTDTYGGHHIPRDFDFPLYHVGNLSQILCDDCGAPVSLVQPTLPSDPPPSRPPIEEDVGPPPATDFQVFPRPGTIIPTDPQFGLTFNEGILAASINGFAATGSRLRWTVTPVLAEGSVSLDVRWINQDGSTGSKRVGPYTVRDPDTAPPRIIRGTVVNGALRVNPRGINAGGFRYHFDEPVTGSIRLVDAFGINLNWSATVADRVATLAPAAGQELNFETAYAVEIDVRDAAGNRSQLRIVFVTNLIKK
jgi:hypothetical protein